MKKHLLFAALVAAVLPQSKAFDNTIWTFDNTLESASGEGLHSSTGSYTNGSASYTDSGLTSGTKVGDYTLTQDLGKAIDLNGSGYIKLNDSHWSSIDATTSYTLMAWVKASSDSTGTGSIFGTGQTDQTGFKFDLRDYKTPQLVQKMEGVNYYDGAPITLNQWYNVAITVDGSTNAVSYYINGKFLGTDKKGNMRTALGPYAAIGAGSYEGQDKFKGQIAELQVLSGTLTQTQILKAAHLTPEPTTATLSLLALAGLAARRRR